MDSSVLCTDDCAASPETGSLPRSAHQIGAKMSEKSSETLSKISKSLCQENTPDLDCLKPPAHLSLDIESRPCSYFGSSEAVLPLLPSDLGAPIYAPDFKEPILSFSLAQDSAAPQTLITSVPEPLSSCCIISDHSGDSSPPRPLSDSIDKDTASAPVSDLYIFESQTQDYILCPKVAREDFKGPDCDSRVLTCGCGHAAECCGCHSSQEGVMLDRESDMSHSETLIPRAGDACETAPSVNDAQEGVAEGADLTPQMRCCDNPVELWLDACQYLAGEGPDDVLHEVAHSIKQEVPMLTKDLDSPTTDTPVSGYSCDGCEGIGCSDDDTAGRGPPVERWSSVDSWASALSDWTGIITALPQDLTAAFTEIGAEIDALTQALAEVNAQLHRETTDDGKNQEPAGQLQQLMGVQDQPLKPHNLPICLQDGDDSQRVRLLCDTNAMTQGVKEREEIQRRRTELDPCPTHLSAPTAPSSDTVASPGGCVTDVIPGSLYPADVDLGGCDERDASVSNNEHPVILKIIEDTDLEKAPRELLIEESNTDKQFKGTDVCGRCFTPPGHLVGEETQRNSTAVEADREGTDVHSFHTRTLIKSHVSGVHTRPFLHINCQEPPDASPDLVAPACNLEPQRGSPKFITPQAPLSVGSSHGRQANGEVRRSVNVNTDLCCGHEQPCIGWPTSDGIHVKPSLEGEALTQNSPAEELPSKEQLDSDRGYITERKTIEDIHAFSRELSNLAAVPGDSFVISEEKRLAVFTLDIDDPFVSMPLPAAPPMKPEKRGKADKMPHKNHKSTAENKSRPKKDKLVGHPCVPRTSKNEDHLLHHVSAQQVCKQQESQILSEEKSTLATCEGNEVTPVPENAEKASNKVHGKKKKKHVQHATGARSVGEPLAGVENGAKPKTTKGRVDMFEAKLGSRAGNTQKDSDHSCHPEKKSLKPEAKIPQDQTIHHTGHKDHQPKSFSSPLNDEIKRRRLSGGKFAKMVNALDPKLPKAAPPHQESREETKADGGALKKAYSEVVKQKTAAKEEPKVVKSIQAEAVSGDPQSLCLWCQFTAVFSHHTITWSRGGTVLSELKRSAGDESRVTLTISHASQKDLGKYQCRLTSLQGSVTLDYLLTYEALSEIVIPLSPKISSAAPAEVVMEEEDVQCSRLLFKEDFLSTQYFGENQPVSIVTEKVHFGEGMHRRAFRTKLHTGQVPLLLSGDSCVLKVHNSISHWTKNNEDLIQRNFHLAVEECQVQNTAREYIKAYTTAAQSVEAFGDIPEIIPIYLVHRPSNEIPYATLEEELIGDFVKYSVKDGKEINLKRRDSEAGQKCCAFQHWVYHKTEGNLLVTDMQGVGMKLTDVGIATTKKGYKGFKGNCATSFIEQFKVLHQCNKFCEILGLHSLQPKAKKSVATLKSKAQPPTAPKKKTFGPTVKGKS
ncbi:alpha-protein kinase 2 [Takifugu rubripes]|uniref:non-specific serine/threonine protein kinase n=1 Tax=Takifugu rubripes TaxID=31033 RepID=A0A674P3V6_TAKRU|nr:alpha-protein kinase 2 [Takifugu rubripes]XP_029693484.1 alpha-protein kinase 2 [Takifugu rubripes]